jgi:hypothetical protein
MVALVYRCAWFAVAGLLAASPAAGQTTVSAEPSEAPATYTLPVSLERIREILARRPLIFVAPLQTPDFRVRVQRAVHIDFEDPRLEEPPPTTMGNSVGIDVLGLVKGLISKPLRARAERAAKAEVREAQAEYCASLPDKGASVSFCPK